MVLCLQLAVGCQGEMFQVKNLGDVIGDDEVQINGSIAKTFQAISDFILPSAVAGETGTLYIYDATDPTALSELHQEKLINQAEYSVKLKREAVDGKLLKVEFIADDNSKSRVLLVEPSDNSKLVSASLSAVSTAEHRIIFASLEQKLLNSEIDRAQVADAFQELKTQDFESTLGLIGDKEALIKLLNDPAYSKDATQVLMEYSKTEEDAAKLEYFQQLASYVNQAKVFSSVGLTCSGLKAYATQSMENTYVLRLTPSKDLISLGLAEDKTAMMSGVDNVNIHLRKYTEQLYEYSSRFKEVAAKVSLYDDKETLLGECILSNDGTNELGVVYADLSWFQNFKVEEFSSFTDAVKRLDEFVMKNEDHIFNQLSSQGFSGVELESKLDAEMAYVVQAYKEAYLKAEAYFDGELAKYYDLNTFLLFDPSQFSTADEAYAKISGLRDEAKALTYEGLVNEGLKDPELSEAFEKEMVVVEQAVLKANERVANFLYSIPVLVTARAQ
jgi:hypothetical protein